LSYRVAAEVALGGEYCRLKMSGQSGHGGGTRGIIQGFSRASRRRLLDLVNQVDRGQVQGDQVLFVTLTYPSAWSQDWSLWKRDLQALIRRLKRRYPGISGIWRLEFQKRGAPHFHLLIFGVFAINRGWLSESWYKIVGSRDPKHLVAGTQVSRIRSWRGILFYVAKYMAKTDKVDFPTGRVWGVIGGVGLPITMAVIRLSVREFYQVRRILRRYLARRLGRRVTWGMSKMGGLKVYLPSSVFVALVMSI
jgi:hypothetical protein